jgi:hypothetical protein
MVVGFPEKPNPEPEDTKSRAGSPLIKLKIGYPFSPALKSGTSTLNVSLIEEVKKDSHLGVRVFSTQAQELGSICTSTLGLIKGGFDDAFIQSK